MKTPILFLILLLLVPATASAGFVDFEDGTDGAAIGTSIPDLLFAVTGGQDWLYGDFRTGLYDGPSPSGSYYADGHFFAWMGVAQGSGDILFLGGTATYFTIGYSAQYQLVLEAYNAAGNMIDTVTGSANLVSGQLDYLTVRGAAIAYVSVREGTGFGNYWIIDDILTDAVTSCQTDDHCDDGVFCNGQEECIDGECVEATEPACGDDGLYCNGEESCNETANQCEHSGDPCVDDGVYCNGDESCDEDSAQCVHSGDPCPDDGLFCNGEESCDEESAQCARSDAPCEEDESCDEAADTCVQNADDTATDDTGNPTAGDDDSTAGDGGNEAGWPKGDVTGGCCGCA